MSAFPAFSSRNFVLLWSGLIVSNVGTWMQNVAQSWVIYEMTHNDPLYLGWLGLSFSVPMSLGPPLGGIVADRAKKIPLLYVTQSSQLTLAAILAILAWTGALRPWHILTATFLGAALLAIDNPARQALIPDLVPRAHLQNALSLGSATFTGAALVGPAIAGALLEPIGAAGLFAMNAVSYLAVIGALFGMRETPPHVRAQRTLKDALFGGLAYVWRDKVALSLVLLAMIAALCARSYPQLLPIFARDVWHAGPRGYGALLSAGGAGAVMGALGLSSRADISHKGRVLLGSGVVLVTSLVLFACAPGVWTGSTWLLLAGIASTVFTTMIATVIQLRVPPNLRGRVMGVYVITLIGLPPLGSFGLASLARVLASNGAGVAHAARWIVGSAALVLGMALAATFRPLATRKLEHV